MKKLAYLLLKHIATFFFDRKYLSGDYFDGPKEGWRWVVEGIWQQKILGFNRKFRFPIHYTVKIYSEQNIILGKNTINNLQSRGCYYQNFSAKIILGDNCLIGPNVGIITANHNLTDKKNHTEGRDVVIGENCWIGMNSVILPGVTLAKGIVVGAGSVVNKSFFEENILIAGTPAKKIKRIYE